jgi:hypothetical protein
MLSGLAVNQGAHLVVVQHSPPALVGTPSPLTVSSFGFGGYGFGGYGFGGNGFGGNGFGGYG